MHTNQSSNLLGVSFSNKTGRIEKVQICLGEIEEDYST